ncbi:MAG: hypothetical protein ACJ8DZ_10030 [Allosphingosinicella sp.]
MNPDTAMMFAVMTALVLVANQLGRVMRAMMLHRTIRKGIEHNSNLTPELFDKIDGQKASGGLGDDRIAVVLIALGLAVLGFGLVAGDDGDLPNTVGIALFPLFVGAALLGRWFYARRHGAEG